MRSALQAKYDSNKIRLRPLDYYMKELDEAISFSVKRGILTASTSLPVEYFDEMKEECERLGYQVKNDPQSTFGYGGDNQIWFEVSWKEAQ